MKYSNIIIPTTFGQIVILSNDIYRNIINEMGLHEYWFLLYFGEIW